VNLKKRFRLIKLIHNEFSQIHVQVSRFPHVLGPYNFRVVIYVVYL